METWRGVWPMISRVLGLVAGAIVLTVASIWVNQPINWHLAVLYGTVLGVAMRWPIIMPSTGSRVVLITGLIFHAIWQDGILTSFAALLVEFGVRMISLHTAHRLWEWYRPVIVMGVLGAAWGISLLFPQPSPDTLWYGLHTDPASFVLVYSFWLLLNLVWSLLRAPVRGRPGTLIFLQTLRQTWWVSLFFLGVGYLMTLVTRVPYPLEVPVALLLLWAQSFVGPIFTTLHQDRAVSRMLRLAPWQSPQERSRSKRVLRFTYALGRTLHLPDDELRIIGYAALLQDVASSPEMPTPLWYPRPQEVAMIRHHNDRVLRQIEEDGLLQDVANLVRYRHAAFDGSGYPGAVGDAIPMGAQVLTAANAMVHLTSAEGDGLTPEEAVRWLRIHASGRFRRELLHAMLFTLTRLGSVQDRNDLLPQTITQLRSLVGGERSESVLSLGFRRALTQLRSRVTLQPELPEEVQAVAQLSKILTTSRDLDEAAGVLVQTVGELVNAKVALALSDDQSDDLNMRFRATHEYRYLNVIGRHLAVQGGYMSRALLRQEPTQLADLAEASSPLAQEIARIEGIRSALFVPLVSQGRAIGLLVVGVARHHWFTPREVGLIHLMADLAATTLEKARLVTELEERIQHISSLKEFTDNLLDNLSKAIIVVDPEGNLALANAAAHQHFGSLEHKGEPLPPELQAVFPVERALAGESLGEFDVSWHSLILTVQVSPLRDGSGALLGAVCQARDVTRIRQMEERTHRLEKLAAVAELAAGAAHEIRNPLTSIRGFMQLLQAQGREEQSEYFQIMLNEIDRIDAIIRDLLLLARPSRVQRAPTDLAAIVEEILLLEQAELTRHSITVERVIQPGGLALLDPNMFRQLLLNLLINAVQAMPFGGQITIGVARIDPGEIILQFSDTGVGIAPENLKRLFDPFFTTKEEGTGLGLSLCHSIVQAHGGHIEVESKVGVGTTFMITLHAPMESVR